MLPSLMNMLSWWQWLILAAVPPAIIALYFLKLKRRPLEVPSTYLWHKSIEDLHVNTIWQRLRRNLLLFLQLLLVLLIMLAVMRPGMKGAKLLGNRFIFLIDNSASMQSTDLDGSRLEDAKRSAREAIELMQPGDVAMVVSFSNTPKVEQMFTESKRSLLRSVDEIKPTSRTTSLAEALKVASGLANPGRSASDATDVQVAEAKPATLYIFSDGKFPETSISLGNLEPIYMPIGTDDATNVGIAIFNVRRNESRAEQLQAFARLENHSKAEASVSIELLLDGEMIDAARLQIGAGEAQGFERDLGELQTGKLELAITEAEFFTAEGEAMKDQFALDNRAWTVARKNRPANVLLVTPGCEPLEYALSTGLALKLANVTLESPDALEDKKSEYYQREAVGAYDLIIYDRCRPKVMPQANTFFLGAMPVHAVELPPEEEGGEPRKLDIWQTDERTDGPRIIDIDSSHPLAQWIAMGNVLIAEAAPIKVPSGGSVLVDSDMGPLMAIAPRDGFEDLVLAFPFMDEITDDKGIKRLRAVTNWQGRSSYPVFMLNLLQYFGGGQAGLDALSAQPGGQVALMGPEPGKELDIHKPSGDRAEVPVDRLGRGKFSDTEELGIYDVQYGGKPIDHFSVNLFDVAESDISVRQEIELGHIAVKGRTSNWEAARTEFWKYILLAGFVLLLVEWWVYHRRVYV
jgi:von Willebrand factor type A domain/Aerotolerance regulator N-terminal